MTGISSGVGGSGSQDGGGQGADGGERALRIRVSKGRPAKAGAAGSALVKQVQSAMQRAGRGEGAKAKGMPLAGRGGRVLAGSGARAQRVLVKARVVAVPKSGGKAAVMRYLGYIEREGGAADGGVSQRFDADGVTEDKPLEDFATRCASDRHSFRLIVSAEHGAQMDLEQHTRDLMGQVERDLGTGLEWVAAVHHDTDNPHVHILVRGVDDRGQDLVIHKDYISRGIRLRAGELATRELGYRTDLDVVRSQRRSIHLSQWTGVDAELVREQVGSTHNCLDYARTPASAFAKARRDIKLQRLGVLREHGLAEEVAPGRWRISENAREVLQSMTGESARSALLKPHLEAEQSGRYALPDKDSLKAVPVRGIVLERGLANTLTGTEFVVVGGFDGRVHYTTVGHYAERHLSQPAHVGDTITLSVATPSAASSADRNVLKRLDGGVYSPEKHLAEVGGWKAGVLARVGRDVTPESYVVAHVKRLEALASRGHVEALPGGRFRVPGDLLERIDADPALNRDRQGVVRVDVEARGSLSTNARVVAQSFMDGELEGGALEQLRTQRPLTRSQAVLLDALDDRSGMLAGMGLAHVAPSGAVAFAPGFQASLRASELATATGRLSATYGQPADIDAARRFQGTVARIEALPSGPHAVIVSEDTFALVPAKGGLERMAGRSVEVTLPRGAAIGHTSFQQTRLRYMAMDEMTPKLDLGLGRERR